MLHHLNWQSLKDENRFSSYDNNWLEPSVPTHSYNYEEFEDTKVVIIIRKSKKKTTQRPKENVQKNKQRSTKHTHKTKDRVTRTPLTTGMNSGAPEG
jgi:hypothetical protein